MTGVNPPTSPIRGRVRATQASNGRSGSVFRPSSGLSETSGAGPSGKHRLERVGPASEAIRSEWGAVLVLLVSKTRKVPKKVPETGTNPTTGVSGFSCYFRTLWTLKEGCLPDAIHPSIGHDLMFFSIDNDSNRLIIDIQHWR